MIMTFDFGIGFMVSIPTHFKKDRLWDTLEDIADQLGVSVIETNKGACYVLNSRTNIEYVKSEYIHLYNALQERGFNPIMPEKLNIGNMMVGGACLYNEDDDLGEDL